MLFHAGMVNLQSHDTFRMSTVYFESDEELFSQDLNSTGDPEYRPPRYFRTGRHSSFINFAIFHLKCTGFDLGSSPEMEEGPRGVRCLQTVTYDAKLSFPYGFQSNTGLPPEQISSIQQHMDLQPPMNQCVQVARISDRCHVTKFVCCGAV